MVNSICLLALSAVPGIGSARIRKLVGHFGSACDVYKAPAGDRARVAGLDAACWLPDDAACFKWAESQFQMMERCGGMFLTWWDESFPSLLKNSDDAPAFLFYKGSLTGIEEGLAVVGTRRPTPYGRAVAREIAAALASESISVVSGLARGIDTIAHREAIRAGGRSMAVLGSGLDVVYPPENQPLFETIVENGCVFTEFSMGTEPLAPHFPRRNRIISGLSRGTLVVEAGEKSGALITAYSALEQGREVFAVPGSIKSEKSRGCHRLLREGAVLVESIGDILSEIPAWKKRIPRAVLADTDPPMTDKERSIWQLLSGEPMHIDEVALSVRLTVSEALALLLSMELKGIVRQHSGMLFSRS